MVGISASTGICGRELAGVEIVSNASYIGWEGKGTVIIRNNLND